MSELTTLDLMEQQAEMIRQQAESVAQLANFASQQVALNELMLNRIDTLEKRPQPTGDARPWWKRGGA